MTIDFGKAAEDYAQHRVGFPDELFHRIRPMGLGLRGQTTLDIGTGTGTLARGFALRGCNATGLDPSSDLMEQAAKLDAAAGVSVDYVVGSAEQTGLPDASFDGISAGQCWHWFDGEQAAREVFRLLKPGGWLLIAHYDWIPLPGNVSDATESLIKKYNPDWGWDGRTGVWMAWPRPVGMAGFVDMEVFGFDHFPVYTHEAWRGRIRASSGVTAGGLSPDQIAAFDEAHRQILAERFPDDPFKVHHRVFAYVFRKPRP